MSRRLVSLASALGLAILLLPSPAAASPVTVKVMTLNIFYGGDEWNLRDGSVVHGQGGLPGDDATRRLDDRGSRPRHRRSPGSDGERMRVGRDARLVLRAPPPADLSLPLSTHPARTACTSSPR